MCRNRGVTQHEYLANNSKLSLPPVHAQPFQLQEVIRYAGVGAHHHNGIAKQNIQSIMDIARTMMLHLAIHWPDVANSTLWPLAVKHAVFLVNRMPNPRTGLFLNDNIFTETQWEQKKMMDFHVWAGMSNLCP